MGNTGLRPDESARLEFRDVSIVKDKDTGKIILEIEVRGKRGIAWCKSMPGAVPPFKRLQARLRLPVSPSPARRGPICSRGMDQVAGHRPAFPDGAPSHPQSNPRAGKAQEGQGRETQNRVQLAAHLHLFPPHGGCGHLSGCEELPHQCGNDRGTLRTAHQERLDASAINVRRGAVSTERKSQVARTEME